MMSERLPRRDSAPRTETVMGRRGFLQAFGLGLVELAAGARARERRRRPNFVFILTDDQRHDAVGYSGNALVKTPHLDRLAQRGTKFSNAFVVLSICCPSRAACLTGRYGSRNGVAYVGGSARLHDRERTFAHYLKDAGYATAMVGKWHLANSPQACGFDFVTHFVSNGPQWNRQVNEHGQKKTAHGFIEDYNADQAIAFLDRMKDQDKPFVLFLCTQLAHMDHNFDWKPKTETLARYADVDIPVPRTWRDDLAGKPPYLKQGRNRMQALKYGYDKAENIREHLRRYYAAIEDTDAALGRVIDAVKASGYEDDTYYLFMGDNGWFMGEHGFTSKVLPYEESIRVPMFAAGPGIEAGTNEDLVLNIDWAPTMMELAGLARPSNMHGKSLVSLFQGRKTTWRESFLYEAPVPCLGSQPLLAVRTGRWKLVQTFETQACEKIAFEELYDLQNDPEEMQNLANDGQHAGIQATLAQAMARHRNRLRSS